MVGFNLREKEGKEIACFAQELGRSLELAVAESGQIKPEVTEKPTASITADTPVAQGNTIVVQWQGPCEKYDAIQIFDPDTLNGKGKVLRSKQIRPGKVDEKKVNMPAPPTSSYGTISNGPQHLTIFA